MAKQKSTKQINAPVDIGKLNDQLSEMRMSDFERRCVMMQIESMSIQVFRINKTLVKYMGILQDLNAYGTMVHIAEEQYGFDASSPSSKELSALRLHASLLAAGIAIGKQMSEHYS